MLIYAHHITPRLTYIFTTIFTDVLKVKITFTNDVAKFESEKGAKINYSASTLNSGIYFQSTHLLFETGIKKQTISIFEFNENPCFFAVEPLSEFPFDPFAASFYLISRYEEYLLPHNTDEHGRFMATESLAFQHNFLKAPLVNIWVNKIAVSIEEHYTNYKFPKRDFKYHTTIDIDNAFAYKHKGFIRTTGALIKALLKGADFTTRFKTIFGNKKDPYDTFDYQTAIHKKYNTNPIYFFLLADYGKYDKNISVKNNTFQALIKVISAKHEVGIHPSYSSNNCPAKIVTEIYSLQKISRRKIIKSRQHYLKLKLPSTYQHLINSGIKEDYTMGYADEPGFRASICSPYYFYDLENEKVTNLKIFPFAVMEASFQYYKKDTPEKALEHILSLMQIVKHINGTFISVWHNESLSNKGIWSGWKKVYEKMLKEASNTI